MRKLVAGFTLLLIFVALSVHDAAGLTKLEQERIQQGMKAAQAVAKVMKTLDAVKWIAKIGTVAGPLLSIAILAVDIALAFMDIESPEMIKMKAEFNSLNSRLDQFSVHFEEVKRKIDWSAVQLTYEKYESTIRVLHGERTRLFKIKDKAIFEEEKRWFISKYESDFKSAASKLYKAMSSESLLSSNIFDAARRYTENHERLTFEFMKGTTQLLLQAYSIEITYIKFKFNDSDSIEFFKQDVEKKLNDVQENAKRVHSLIYKNWENQMKKDVSNQIILKKGSSNEYFSKYLYEFLDDKYPWRQWFVLSYAEATDSRKHAAHTCGGVRYINLSQRNTVVSSVAKNATRVFQTQKAHDFMRNLISFRVSSNYGEKILNVMFKFNDKTKCSTASVLAAVRRWDHRKFQADAWIYTDRARLHWEEFCVYKCNTDLCWVKKNKCFAVIFWG